MSRPPTATNTTNAIPIKIIMQAESLERNSYDATQDACIPYWESWFKYQFCFYCSINGYPGNKKMIAQVLGSLSVGSPEFPAPSFCLIQLWLCECQHFGSVEFFKQIFLVYLCVSYVCTMDLKGRVIESEREIFLNSHNSQMWAMLKPTLVSHVVGRGTITWGIFHSLQRTLAERWI